jgi:pyridoxine 4-dehydrogenase
LQTSSVTSEALLLPHSPNILLIPGTSSVEHLRENLKAASLQLPPEMVGQAERDRN